MTKTFGILWLLLVLGGCASPKVQFHTLMPPPEQALETRPDAAAIQLEQVLVPAYVDRSELVVRQGDTGLVVLSSDWWGATLAEEIRSALMARLAASSGQGEPVRVAVRLTRFDAVAGRGAWVTARYRVSAGKRSLLCISEQHTRAGEGVESLVTALQTSVAGLADEILAASRAGSDSWRCPGP
ncbi:MAG: PqiC family protein [Marinobacter sp.]|uniref:PqiC family protein n=1 Tax=Marinobacter sp. TaxID=50741 RepID=UPI00299E1921|nr:PqiC family protein [Marinobacter sp.]MDX1634824.1 PqiC family protein [Marinobacter sp.]